MKPQREEMAPHSQAKLMKVVLCGFALLSLLFGGKVAYDIARGPRGSVMSEHERLAHIEKYCTGSPPVVTGTTVNIYGANYLENGDGGACALHLVSSVLPQYPRAHKFVAHWNIADGRHNDFAVEYDRQRRILRRIERRAGHQPSIQTYQQVSENSIDKAAERFGPVGRIVNYGAVEANHEP